ncbi:MAG: metal ABC transporter substrate-binding protein [Candidatus Lokiarchaeota archaeon]|nr:metal ABC transporter substrate-binding protein [Candidatus Harpocratesius repetitus]
MTPSSVNAQSSSQIKVVASTELLQDFAQQVGGNFIDITAVLVEGTEDPHTYEPVQSEINALMEADVLLLMGRSDLEPWWNNYKETVLTDNPNLCIVSVMNESMVEKDPLLNMENPHGWMSPKIAKEMAHNIYLAFKELLNSEDETLLTQQYSNYIKKLDNLLTEINSEKDKYAGLKVVVHHPSFMYLYDLLGIQRIAIIEEQHDVEPSPQHIQAIKDIMKAENCTTIVSQTNLDNSLVLQLARDMNSSIVWGIPLLGMKTTNDTTISAYIDMIEYNLWALEHPEIPSDATSSIPGYYLGIFGGTFGVAIIILLVQPKFKKLLNTNVND